jgi:hypothetical protein
MKAVQFSLVSLLLAGCVAREQNVRNAFTASYDCPAEQVSVRAEARDRYEAAGCGKSARVTCTEANICYVAAPAPQANANEEGAEADLLYAAHLEQDVLLEISAWPAEAGRVELELTTPRGADCYLNVVVDDQPLELRRGKADSYTVPLASMQVLTSADRVSVTACGGEWSLNAKQLDNLRQFASAFAEELKEEGAPSAPPPAGG